MRPKYKKCLLRSNFWLLIVWYRMGHKKAGNQKFQSSKVPSLPSIERRAPGVAGILDPNRGGFGVKPKCHLPKLFGAGLQNGS